MYKQLTTEHSLYCMNEENFKLFLSSAEMHDMEDYVANALSLNSLDSYAIVLHIWCLLNEKELKLFLNTDKMMAYSIDHYILSLLRSQKKIQEFLKSRVMTQSMKYVLAYYLACATLQWGDTIILEHERGEALCEKNRARNYYTLSEEENLAQTENRDFSLFQKTIIQLMAADFQKTKRFNEQIENALLQTRRYLRVKACLLGRG